MTIYRGRYRKRAYVLVWLFLIGFFPISGQALDVDPDLEEEMNADETTGYIISFRRQALLRQPPQGGWKEQRAFIMKSLRQTAERSQARVRKYLFDRKIPHRTLWNDNIIIVDKSDRETFEGLKTFPEIEAIRIRQRIVQQSVEGHESLKQDSNPSENRAEEDKDGKMERTVGTESDAEKNEP